jgi:hypothetical protein
MIRSRVAEGDEEGAWGRSYDLEVATDGERASSRAGLRGEVGTVGLGAVLLGFLVRLAKMPSGSWKDIKKL